MDKPEKEMDAEEKKIQKLAEDINPAEDIVPDSDAEVHTALLDDDALGGTVSQDDVHKHKR